MSDKPKFNDEFPDLVERIRVGKEKLKVDGLGKVSSLEGLTEAEAKAKIEAAGLVARITRKDGELYIVTRDYRLDRINLEIVKEKVTKAYTG